MLGPISLVILLVPLGSQPAATTPSGTPPANQLRTDRHGDPLPAGAVARLGTLRWRTTGAIASLAYSPDGKTVAAATNTSVNLFASDGKLIQQFRAPDIAFGKVVFSPDGKSLACTAFNRNEQSPKQTVQVRTLPVGRVVIGHETSTLGSFGWSPSGEPRVVEVEKDAVVVRELRTKKTQRFAFPGPDKNGHVPCVLGAKLLAAFDRAGHLHIWDLAAGKKRHTIDTKADWTDQASFAADDRVLVWHASVGQDQCVQRCDTINGKVSVLMTSKEPIYHVGVVGETATVALVQWDKFRFWDLTTGREGASLTGLSSFNCFVFTPDGKSVALADSGSQFVRVWDLEARKPRGPLAGHPGKSRVLDVSPDGKRAVTGSWDDGPSYCWDLATGAPVAEIQRPRWTNSVAFSRDGKSLTAFSAGERLTLPGGTQFEPLEHSRWWKALPAEWGMDFSADRKKVVAYQLVRNPKQDDSEDFLLTGWDASSQTEQFRRVRPHPWGYALSPDQQLFAAGGNASGTAPVRFEDVASGDLLFELPEVEGQTRPVMFSPDARLLATAHFFSQKRADSLDGFEIKRTVRLWEVASARELLQFHTVQNGAMGFSRDSRLFAVSAPKEEAIVWDLWQGKEVRRFKGQDAPVSALHFTPDARRLVSGLGNGSLLVWDVSDVKKTDAAPLDEAGVKKAWADLAGEAGKAFTARGTLARSPEKAVALLQAKLKPVTPVDAREVRRLIAELDAGEFATRDKARRTLEDLGDRAAGVLQDSLKQKLPLEQHRRIRTLLRRLPVVLSEPEALRGVRAVAVLEDINTPAARKLLESVASGAAGARLTREAQSALGRLAER